MKPVTIMDAVRDPNLFAPWFRDPTTWAAWFTFLCTLFALPLTPDQLAIFQHCTGRDMPPVSVVVECWLVCGRRAGKSFMFAITSVFLAVFVDWRAYLQPGERGVILIIATDRKQARVIFNYVRALLTQIPMLAALIERETAESFELSNMVTIEIGTASYRTTRGYTFVAVLCDEIAFWPSGDDAAEPDYAILDAVRPGMATIPGAMLLCASSPYARRGALWDAYRCHYAKDGDPILVWRAATRTMNSTVPQHIIDQADARDLPVSNAEYRAMFRPDLEQFVSLEALEAVTSHGVTERGRLDNTKYFGFTDPSGGSRDSFTAAVAHLDGKKIVLDAVREKKAPCSPQQAVDEHSEFFKSYGIRSISGDRYGGTVFSEMFKRKGIECRPSELSKSDIYLHNISLINSGMVVLLDHATLHNQLFNLERRTARGGRDSVDHPPNGRDDVANAACGAIHLASAAKRKPMDAYLSAPTILNGGTETKWGHIEL